MTVYIVLMLLALAGYAFSANASEINRKRYLCLVFSAIVIVTGTDCCSTSTQSDQFYKFRFRT